MSIRATAPTQEQMQAIIAADRIPGNIGGVSSAIIDCGVRYGLTIPQIETALRANRCMSFLIAQRQDPSHGRGVSIQFPPGTPRTYQILISMRPEPLAMLELLAYSVSYQENLDKLADTGFIFASATKPLSAQIKSPHFKPSGEGKNMMDAEEAARANATKKKK